MTRLSILLVSIALASTGCDALATREEASQPTGPAPVDPADPAKPADPSQPTAAVVAGVYEVVTTFDLTLDVVLPGPAHDVVGILADFRADPAATLFGLLEDAGVPLVGELMDALPNALESRLYGWINDYLASAVFQDTPVLETIDQILAVAHTSLTRFDMVSELTLAAEDADGHAAAEHRVRALRYTVDGTTYDVAVPDLGPVTSTRMDAWIDRSPSGAHLTVGEHTFGLPYGEYAYQALEYASQVRYGMSVRQAVGAAVDCPALAADVADHCVLGVCVGHEQALTSLCEQGLDMVVEELHSRFAAYTIEAMELASGEADMVDAAAGQSADGTVDHLRAGTWQASINLGMGLREIAAEFQGARL